MISVVLHSGPGLDDYNLQLANALSEVARVAYSMDEDIQKRYGNALSSRVTRLIFRRPRRRQLWGFQEMKHLAGLIHDFQPDVFHLQNDGLWESVLLRFLGPLPVINTIFDPIKHLDQRYLLNTLTQRDAVRRARGWVTHSDGLACAAREKFGLDPARILVHPMGVFDYYARFDPGGARQKQILFFGELRQNKGYDCLLRAFEACRPELPDWQLVIAGKGTPAESARPVILRLDSQLDFRNRFIPDAEVGELFARAGIVALPYREGSTSGVLAIAAAFGCPVLCTATGSMPEVMENGKHVYFVEAGDEQALAEGILHLARDAGLRQSLGAELAELGRTQWQWERIARLTVDFYEKIQSADQR